MLVVANTSFLNQVLLTDYSGIPVICNYYPQFIKNRDRLQKHFKMKRIKNLTLGILGATVLSLGLYACNNDNNSETLSQDLKDKKTLGVKNNKDYTHIYTSGRVDFIEILSKSVNDSIIKKLDTGSEKYFVETTVKTNLFIPKELKENELNAYLNANIDNFDGEIEYKFNDEVDSYFVFERGVIVEEYSIKKEYPRANECSVEGIRQCANKAIYSMGLISKITCAFAFYECYAIAAGDCYVDNCTDLNKK